MHKELEQYTREQLENILMHMVSFLAYKLATEYIELTEPTASVIRTPEAEHENTLRIHEHMVCIWPAWDIVEKTHPGYDIMKEWVKKNHEQVLLKPCICVGCKKPDVLVN
jgi:hypothetical protein